MARFKTSFISSERSELDSELECYVNQHNEIFIRITEPCDEVHQERYVCLDISTAIKFAKSIRTEINKAKEVSNG